MIKDNFRTHAAPLFEKPSLALAAFPTAHFLIKLRDSWARVNGGKAYQPVPCDPQEIKFCQMMVDKGMVSWCNRDGTPSVSPVHLKVACPNTFHSVVAETGVQDETQE